MNEKELWFKVWRKLALKIGTFEIHTFKYHKWNWNNRHYQKRLDLNHGWRVHHREVN